MQPYNLLSDGIISSFFRLDASTLRLEFAAGSLAISFLARLVLFVLLHDEVFEVGLCNKSRTRQVPLLELYDEWLHVIPLQWLALHG